MEKGEVAVDTYIDFNLLFERNLGICFSNLLSITHENVSLRQAAALGWLTISL